MRTPDMKTFRLILCVIILLAVCPSKAFSQWSIGGKVGLSMIKRIPMSKKYNYPLSPGVDLNVISIYDNFLLVSGGSHLSLGDKDSSLLQIEEFDANQNPRNRTYGKSFTSSTNYKDFNLKLNFNLLSNSDGFVMIYTGFGLSYVRISTSYFTDPEDPEEYLVAVINKRTGIYTYENVNNHKTIINKFNVFGTLGAMYEFEHFRIFGECDVHGVVEAESLYLITSVGIVYPF